VLIAGNMGLGLIEAMRTAGVGMLWQLARMALSPADFAWTAVGMLLAEAGVPYDLIADMDDINPEFATTDVALVIGANDVVNPLAKTDPASPIYGMPILDVSNAKQVIVIKRGRGTGFAGIENALLYADNTRMLYGDGQAAVGELVTALKDVDG
jgi:NAD(P) transhydrogenase subunit beta